MVLSILALCLVLAITFYQSMFGLFSAIINTFCSIMAVAVTFGFFAVLNDFVTGQGIHPAYSEPCCFVGLFVVSLGVMRYAADTFIRGNVRLPMYADWVGGGLLGFINAQIAVGVLMIGFQMLPFGGSVMMFSRFERDSRGKVDREGFVQFHRNNVGFFLRPDDFAAGLFKILSAGSLKGGNVADEAHPDRTFASVYPDFTEWVSWSGNTVQPESTTSPYRDESGDGFESGLVIESWWEVSGPLRAQYRTTVPTFETHARLGYDPEKAFPPSAGMNWLGAELGLNNKSADRMEERAADHRFRPSMIRLVGTKANGDPAHYTPRILGQIESENLTSPLRAVDLDNSFLKSSNSKLTVYFEVPNGFKPWFIEYRRHARAELTASKKAETPAEIAADATEDTAAPARPRPPGGGGPRPDFTRGHRQGASSFMDHAQEEGTGVSDELPFHVAQAAARGDFDTSGRSLAYGRISGRVSDLRAAAGTASIDSFEVPDDLKLLQIRFKPYQARSTLGQVFNFAGRTLNSYEAVAENNSQRYRLIGYYGIVKRSGEEFIELYYSGLPGTPEYTAFRGALDWKEIRGPELTSSSADAVVGLLFQVPSGTRIVSIETQGGALRDLDFRVP